jgi:hypothetical protein
MAGELRSTSCPTTTGRSWSTRSIRRIARCASDDQPERTGAGSGEVGGTYFRTRHSLSYSSWRRIQSCGESPSSRPFGARSRIA